MNGRNMAGRMKRIGRTEDIHKKGCRRTAVFACVLAAVLCTGCGEMDGMSSNQTGPASISMSESKSSGGLNGAYDIGIENSVMADIGMAGAGIEGGDAGWMPLNSGPAEVDADVTVDTDRKLIKTVSLSVETREFEQAVAALETQVRQLGGYIETMETYNGSRYSGYTKAKYSNMTVRIPKENLTAFLETVSDVCNVTRRNDELTDVTLSYVDMESRRNTLRTEQERLLSFLEKAATVEEIIALEERISEVRYQLESMEKRLRTIDNQVDFATVHLNISEVQELTPTQEQTAWDKLTEGFMGSLGNIGDGIVNFGIWFAVNVPYFALWAILIAAAVVIIRKAHRRNTEKKLAKAAKADAEWKAAKEENKND